MSTLLLLYRETRCASPRRPSRPSHRTRPSKTDASITSSHTAADPIISSQAFLDRDVLESATAQCSRTSRMKSSATWIPRPKSTSRGEVKTVQARAAPSGWRSGWHWSHLANRLSWIGASPRSAPCLVQKRPRLVTLRIVKSAIMPQFEGVHTILRRESVCTRRARRQSVEAGSGPASDIALQGRADESSAIRIPGSTSQRPASVTN